MRFLGILFAGLVDFITRPLFANKLSRYGMYMLNTFLGAIIGAAVLVFILKMDKEHGAVYALLLLLLISGVSALTKKLPDGDERLKGWYEPPAEKDDDKEYFSKFDMHGQPWWKFMYIESWITLIVFNLFWVVGLLIFIFGDDRTFLEISSLFNVIMTPVVIWNAYKRKRDYDCGYQKSPKNGKAKQIIANIIKAAFLLGFVIILITSLIKGINEKY